MDQRRRAEYERYRDEIEAWSKKSRKGLNEAVAAGELPPLTTAPSSMNDTYKRVLRMIDEDSKVAFGLPPMKDLTDMSAIDVIDAINLVLSAHDSE